MPGGINWAEGIKVKALPPIVMTILPILEIWEVGIKSNPVEPSTLEPGMADM